MTDKPVDPPIDGAEPTPPAPEVEADLDAKPEPEPWTPQRVLEWNAYYDVYVAAFVLALAFLGSCNKIQAINSGLWSFLQAGRQISEKASPFNVDPGSIAGEGRRWVNIPWLFEVANYQVFQAVEAIPAKATDPASMIPGSSRGEQFGIGALIAINALVRALTAYTLLGLRRKGPGLWWASFCVLVALGVTLSPEPIQVASEAPEARPVYRATLGIQLGGIANTSTVAPESWGVLFLAVELLLIHQIHGLGRRGRAYALVPLFLLWANVDETYAFGLVVLLASAIGRAIRARNDPEADARAGFVGFGLALLATFVTPSHVFGVLGSIGLIVPIPFGPPSPSSLSVFSPRLAASFGDAMARSFLIQSLVLIAIGLGSFWLNRRRFSPARFLAFAAGSGVWLASLAFTPAFALVLASTLILNGQEWYHDAVGTEGRLGGGWVAFSTGGRLVTIAATFLAIFQATTGWRGQVGQPQFGFGFNPDDFPLEAAATLASAPLKGNILNGNFAQGDALEWRSSGRRRPYIDGKTHLYPAEAVEEFAALRRAIRDDKVDEWRPKLDRSRIGAVMIDTASSPNTYVKLSSSANWIPFYDDGAVTMFGRSDAGVDPLDLAFFRDNSLDADAMAYKRPRPAAPWQRPPTESWQAVDRVFQNRLLNRTQPHVLAAEHWLRPATVAPGAAYIPDPAHCLMAIRELRAALSSKPDDHAAYRLLADAYSLLLAQESALIGGIALTPENVAKIRQAPAQSRFLPTRLRQLLTSLDFAVQTFPPTQSRDDRVRWAQLLFDMAQVEIQNGSLDLAYDRLLQVDIRPGELPGEFTQRHYPLVGELEQRISQVQGQVNDLTARRSSPVEKATYARQSGAPGLAIRELQDAELVGGNGSGPVRSMLVDLLCDTGQPDKAYDLIGLLNIDDQTLADANGPGSASHRQGLMYYLLGDYANAINIWQERSIPAVRNQRSIQAPMAAQSMLSGQPQASTRMLVELPSRLAVQAEWEFELGMAALEGGQPSKQAADHLKLALTLEPDMFVRPVIAYYLEKLGEAVPPPRPEPGTSTTANP